MNNELHRASFDTSIVNRIVMVKKKKKRTKTKVKQSSSSTSALVVLLLLVLGVVSLFTMLPQGILPDILTNYVKGKKTLRGRDNSDKPNFDETVWEGVGEDEEVPSKPITKKKKKKRKKRKKKKKSTMSKISKITSEDTQPSTTTDTETATTEGVTTSATESELPTTNEKVIDTKSSGSTANDDTVETKEETAEVNETTEANETKDTDDLEETEETDETDEDETDETDETEDASEYSEARMRHTEYDFCKSHMKKGKSLITIFTTMHPSTDSIKMLAQQNTLQVRRFFEKMKM